MAGDKVEVFKEMKYCFHGLGTIHAWIYSYTFQRYEPINYFFNLNWVSHLKARVFSNTNALIGHFILLILTASNI